MYLMISTVKVNYLLITHLCFPWFMISIFQLVILMTAQRQWINGLFNEKQTLTQIQINEGKKLYSVAKNAFLHPIFNFNNKPINSIKIHKLLGTVPDSRLSYEDHVKSVLSKWIRRLASCQIFKHFFPDILWLCTIYKSFIRPNLIMET